MGMVRKTFSIATLGAVSFRSKKEKLRRADRSRREAEIALEHEHQARETAETRVAAAEKRVKHATAEAARNTQRLEKAKRRKRRRASVGDMLRETEPAVRSGAEAVRSAGSDAAERGRKAGRKAGRRARKAGRKAADRAAALTKDVVVPGVEKAATKLGESIDEISSR
jgi:membrane protein involved in colicin uptake